MQEMRSKGLFKSKIRSVVFISGFLNSSSHLYYWPGRDFVSSPRWVRLTIIIATCLRNLTASSHNFDPEDRCTMFLRKTGSHLRD